MSESRIITASKAVPLSEKISHVSSQISDWLKTLDKPFSFDKDTLRLTKCEEKSTKYHFRYTIERAPEGSRAKKV